MLQMGKESFQKPFQGFLSSIVFLHSFITFLARPRSCIAWWYFEQHLLYTQLVNLGYSLSKLHLYTQFVGCTAQMVSKCQRPHTNKGGGGRKGGTNTAIPHVVAREYRNTAHGRERKPQYRIKIYPNTETETNGEKLLF